MLGTQGSLLSGTPANDQQVESWRDPGSGPGFSESTPVVYLPVSTPLLLCYQLWTHSAPHQACAPGETLSQEDLPRSAGTHSPLLHWLWTRGELRGKNT